ncbi:MAG: YqaA family protein [Pseudomonadota bacterium]
MIYLTLFLAAFLAATIVPFASEAAVAAAALAGHPVSGVWLAASIGNTLGAALNALLGRLLPRQRLQRWLGIPDQRLAQAERWFGRYGRYSLLLAWLPVVGDAVTVVAGLLRTGWLAFFSLVFIGKGARYAVVIWLALQAVE